LGCRHVDFNGALTQAVFAQRQPVRAEGVGFEHIHADFEKRAVDFFDGFRVRDDEEVVASVVLFAAEVLGGQVLGLQAGAHRAIEDENFLFKGVEVATVGVGAGHWLLLNPIHRILWIAQIFILFKRKG
jgi:hypothetical protein